MNVELRANDPGQICVKPGPALPNCHVLLDESEDQAKQKKWRRDTTLRGVPSGARSRNLLFHRQALCQLSYRHHVEEGGRVSRVLFLMVISLGPFRDRPRRRLRDGSRLPASASNLQAADSEIAAGRIALFSPSHPKVQGMVSVALTRERVPVWTVDALRRLPGFHRAPLLCAARTFL